jgi:hypothetical protein
MLAERNIYFGLDASFIKTYQVFFIISILFVLYLLCVIISLILWLVDKNYPTPVFITTIIHFISQIIFIFAYWCYFIFMNGFMYSVSTFGAMIHVIPFCQFYLIFTLISLLIDFLFINTILHYWKQDIKQPS